MKLEAKIGLFVTMGLVALFLLSTQVTNLGSWNRGGYTVDAYVVDATGLELHTKVAMSGVDIGEIAEIAIEGRRVKVRMRIDENVEIPADSTVSVSQESMLGSKRINLIAGESTERLKAGGTLEHAKLYAPFDETSDSINAAAQEIQLLVQDLRGVLDEKRRSDLQEMITSFRNVGANLDLIVRENREGLKSAIDNVDRMAGGFAQTADTINADLPTIMHRVDSITEKLETISTALESRLPEAVDKFVAIEDNLSMILEENRQPLNNALTSAGDFFGSGQNAFDKVDSMLSNFTVSELQIGARADYMFSDDTSKTLLSLAYLPNPETYYLVDLVSMDDYSRIGVEPALHEEGESYLSAQYGKRFDRILMRAGLIESTGGFGLDYFADHDRMQISFDAYDFNAVNDVRGEDAHLRLMARYRFLKHLEIYAGWDNFINPEADNIFFGVGMKFIDNNLKYVIGSTGMGF